LSVRPARSERTTGRARGPALRPLLAALACVLAAWLAVWPAAHAAVTAARGTASLFAQEDPGGARVIVKYKSQGPLMQALAARGTAAAKAGPQMASAIGRRLGLALRDGRVVDARIQVVRGDASMSSSALAALLAADPDVEYAVPDRRRRALAAPNDPLYPANATNSPVSGQWYLRAPDTTIVSAANAVGAWATTTGSPAVVVADLDTGARYEHPDLVGKLLDGYSFVSTNGGGPYTNPSAEDTGDWATAGQCGAGEPAESSSWHGTQTAGIIGAKTDNGIGIASVGYNIMVQPVRVLAACGGWDSDIIAGMLWAAGLSSIPIVNRTPARVLNMSLGGCTANSGPCTCTPAYVDAVNRITASGTTIVAAAGNAEGQWVSEPGSCPGVVAVGAVRHIGTKVGFSSVGPQIALSAPGGNCVNLSGRCLYPIVTTTNNGATNAGADTYSDGTNYSVGTSFAAPQVSGAVALMLSVNPALAPAQIGSLLRSSARAFPTSGAGSGVVACQAPSATVQDECYCTSTTCGAGMLDAGAAVLAAANAALPSASLVASSSTAAPGASVSFDASGSSAGTGRTVTGYQWAITAGNDIATFAGGVVPSANQASVVVSPAAAGGSFTVAVTVTDSSGQSATRGATVAVQVQGGSGGSGSGGGAMSAAWLALLALAAGVLALPAHRRAGSGALRAARRRA